MRGDMLAILDGDKLRVFSVNGNGAHELAMVKVSETTPDAVASLLHGLKPFLADPKPPLPALMPGLPVGKAAAPRAPVRKRVEREARRPAAEVQSLIVSYLRTHGIAAPREISRALGYATDASVGRALIQLLAEGLVVRESTTAVTDQPGAQYQYWLAS